MRFNRVALSISLHGPLLTHSNYSASTSAVILLSFLPLLIVSLYPSIGSPQPSLLICLSRLPLLHLCFYPSIWISLSLQGTCAQSNRSHHSIHVPLVSYRSPSPLPFVHLWLYRQDHPSASLSLSHIHTDLYFDIQRCFLQCICPLVSCNCFYMMYSFFFCFLLCICPSICLRPPQSKHIPVLRLCFQDNVLIQLNSIFVAVHGNAPPLHYHSNGKLSPFITALINATYTYERGHTHTYQ